MTKSIKINGNILSRYSEIISNEALEFIKEIHEKFNSKRLELVNKRKKRQEAINNGSKLDFLEETKKLEILVGKLKTYLKTF